MKRIIISSVVVLLIIAAFTAGYFYYRDLKMPQAEAISAIPPDAAFIIECKSVKTAWHNLRENKMWQDLQSLESYKKISNNANYIDSVFFANSDLKPFLEDHPLFISAHVTRTSDFEYLYIMQLPRGKRESFVVSQIQKLLTSEVQLGKRVYDGIDIHEFPEKQSGRTFAFAVTKGVLIASFMPFLVEDAIRQLKIGRPFTDDHNFMKVYHSAGKVTDANLYINFKAFPRLLSTITGDETDKGVADLANFANWSEFDVKVLQNTLSLNGLTYANDTTIFLHAFQKQLPQEPELLKILPRRTAILLYGAVSDFPSFYKELKTYLSTKGYRKSFELKVKQWQEEFGMDVATKMTSWIGNEFALAITESNSSNCRNNTFAIFKASNPELAKTSLDEINKAVAAKGNVRIKEESYKGYSIGFINIDGAIPELFGPVFSNVDKLFYTTIKNYVVIGNQASSLRSFIDDFTAGKLLGSDPNFKNVSENLSTKTNGILYVNLLRSWEILKGMLTPDVVESIENHIEIYNKFDAIAMQISSDKGLFYSNAFLHYNVKQNKDVNLLWATQLDTSVTMTPQVVFNSMEKTNEILVQDDSNKLYMIDNSGAIRWKIRLPEKMLGKISQIDLYRNGRLQYLFNTASSIYLIDRNGNNVANYPIRLPASATGGIQLFDYDSTGEYRIFVNCSNDIIYGYQASGKPLGGWNLSKPMGEITRPIQYLRLNGSEYLIVADKKGEVLLLDRKGKEKTEVKEKIYISENNEFYLDSTEGDRPHFVTTDTSGRLVFIYEDGRVKFSRVRNLSNDHYFKFADIDGDGVKDYIFMDHEQLLVLKKDSSVIFKHNFDKDVHVAPEIIRGSGKQNRVAVVTQFNNQISLFNPDGTIYEGFPLKGSTSFSVIDFNKDGKLNLVIGSSDNTVYVYTIQ